MLRISFHIENLAYEWRSDAFSPDWIANIFTFHTDPPATIDLISTRALAMTGAVNWNRLLLIGRPLRVGFGRDPFEFSRFFSSALFTRRQ